MEEKTTIQISKKLKEKLEEMGKKNETYEEILWRLINEKEKTTKKN